MTEAADWKYAPNGGSMLLEPHLIDPPPNAYFDSAASATAPTVSVGVAVGNRNILLDELVKAQFLLLYPVCQIGVFVAQDRTQGRGVDEKSE